MRNVYSKAQGLRNPEISESHDLSKIQPFPVCARNSSEAEALAPPGAVTWPKPAPTRRPKDPRPEATPVLRSPSPWSSLSGRRQDLSHFLLAHTLVSLKGTQLSCGKFMFIPQGWSQPLPPVWPSPPVLGSPRIPLTPLTEVSRGGQEAPSQKTGLGAGFMVVLGRPCCSLTSVRVPSLRARGWGTTAGPARGLSESDGKRSQRGLAQVHLPMLVMMPQS